MQHLHSRSEAPRQSRHTEEDNSVHVFGPADRVYENDGDAFLGRLRDPRWAERFKWAIITLWQSDGISTAEAVWWLGLGGFIETDIHPEQVEAVLQGFVWYERHRASCGGV